MLRFGTQIFSDIPTLASIMGTLYLVWLVLERKQEKVIPLVYLFASLSISLRYASGFFFPSLIIFFWVTRKKCLLHTIGLCLSVIPFIPQLIYNHHHLSNMISISYVAHQPTLSFSYFFQELEFGKKLQIFHYLRDLFFNFKGIFILFSPVVFIGVRASFNEFGKHFACFLLTFFISVVILLSFFAGFSNRYVITALLPCYIWFNIGLKTLFDWIKGHKIKRYGLYTFLFLSLYCNFEICFHAVQSTRAIHYSRYSIINEANALVKDGDIIVCELDISRYFPQFNNISIQNKNVQYINSNIYESILKKNPEPSSSIYCIIPSIRWYSEGFKKNNNSEGQLKNLLSVSSPIAKITSEKIYELSFYKFLRFIHKEYLIPCEEWLIFKIR
jgi:hypothetical protein